jgi:hypothetical protein
MGLGIDGEEAQDLRHLSGLLRSRHFGAFDEGGVGGLGFEDQPVSSGFCEGIGRSGNDCRNDGQARYRASASRRLKRDIQRRRRTSHRPAHREGEEKTPKPATKRREPASRSLDDKAARKAALAFEKKQKRRERQRQSEEKARLKEGERRDRAIAAAQAALEEAERGHRRRVAQIDKDRAAVDSRAQAEDDRWKKIKERLEDALRRSRSASYLRAV